MKGKRRNPFDRLKGAEGEAAAYIRRRRAR
jgi:hypothetical protein